MTTEHTAVFDEEAFIRSMEYQPYNVVIVVYEKYKQEYNRLSTIERLLRRSNIDLDDDEQGRLTVSHAAIGMIKRHYETALLEERNRRRNNTAGPQCSSSGDQ